MKKLSELIAQTVRVSFVGDIMQHHRQLAAVQQSNKEFPYENTFAAVQSELDTANFLIGNLETCVCTTIPLQGYPKFNSPMRLLKGLRAAGFNCLSLANNHILDHGELGIIETVHNAKKCQILPLGVDREPLAKLHNYDRVPIYLHCGSLISNLHKLNPLLCHPKDFKPVITGVNIAYVHGGKEYQVEETDEQIKVTTELMLKGFDIVIWSHSHKVGRIHQFIDGKIVCYGMGNFLSDQESLDRQLGRILHIDITSAPSANMNYKYKLEVTEVLTETVWENGESIVIYKSEL